MVSKNQIKLINALHRKKGRQEHGLFIAEGIKVTTELLAEGMQPVAIYATESLSGVFAGETTTAVNDAELSRMSALTTPSGCLAVFPIEDEPQLPRNGLVVALDDIRDPGNLGTIIRLCDWFGVDNIVCSNETADLYNPKVVQATMGSLARVKLTYTDLPEFLRDSQLPVYGTFMDGENIYGSALAAEGIVIFGNEANGISDAVSKFVTSPISIPRFGKMQRAESLNVATAAAIVLSEFCRRK